MGRKRLRLIDDPDRYAIALIDALIAQGRGSEYACAMSIATLLIGIEGEAPRLSTDGQHIVTTWGRYQTKAEPGTAMTLGGRVSTFRTKRRRYRSAADLRWRTTMGAAFQAVFTLTDRPQAKRVSLAAAKIVGETEFAYRVLWPIIDGEA